MNITDRWFVIVNPVAGRCKGREDWPTICNLLAKYNVKYDALFTEKKYHATEYTVTAINKGYRKIIAVGGDGTLHEIVNGLFIQKVVEPKDITIAVVAIGTGNDWIRTHGIPSDYQGAIETVVNGNLFSQDVVRVDYIESLVPQTRYMANMAGIGFDGAVNRSYTSLKESGYYSKWLYIISMLATLFSYRSIKLSISIDNKQIKPFKLFSAVFAVGKYNGGGMMQAPLAITDDGLIDITLLKKRSNLSVFCHIRKLYNGNLFGVPRSEFYRGKKVVIKSHPASALEIDGEAVGTSPVTFTTLQRAITIVVK